MFSLITLKSLMSVLQLKKYATSSTPCKNAEMTLSLCPESLSAWPQYASNAKISFSFKVIEAFHVYYVSNHQCAHSFTYNHLKISNVH